MSTPEQNAAVSHIDMTHLHAEAFGDDYDKAKTNLDDQHPGYPMNDILASGIAMIMKAERSRRRGHYYRYLTPFDANYATGRILQSDDDPVESSLLELSERIEQMTPAQIALARSMGGKGISAELGHVDQFADWSAASALDARIRELPNSDRLKNAGFVFKDTYGDKSQAKRTYRIHVNGHESSDASDEPSGSVLKAVRRRAAADIITERGDSIEIVKHSTFLIHAAQLGRNYLERLDSVVAMSADKDTAKAAIPLMNEAGELIVEPFITHPEFRAFSPGVLAVSSLYFALHRAK